MTMKTVRETRVGKDVLRLVATDGTFKGVVVREGHIAATETGDDVDRVWMALHDAHARLDPSFFGYDGARARFLKFFPLGFEDPEYARHERDYKIRAKTLVDTTVPLVGAKSGSPSGPAVVKAFQATNLLSPFEKVRLKDALSGPRAHEFLESAAAFAEGDIAGGLSGMAAALRPYDSAKWTVVTYLPYFWHPETHMFLKPEVTIDYATRVGHRFAHVYGSDLEPSVYECLLDLVASTRREIEDLSPRDNIDIQSFLWTAAAY